MGGCRVVLLNAVDAVIEQVNNLQGIHGRKATHTFPVLLNSFCMIVS